MTDYSSSLKKLITEQKFNQNSAGFMNVRHLHDLQVGDNKSLKTTERTLKQLSFLPISINKENLR